MRGNIQRAAALAAASVFFCASASAQDHPVKRTAVKRAVKMASPVVPGPNVPGYWERSYPTGYQYAVVYSVSLHVKSIPKSEEAVRKVVEQEGGSMRNDGNRYFGYGGPQGRGRSQRTFQYDVAAEDADRVNKKLITLGELQNFSSNRQVNPESVAEVESKIDQISAEMSENSESLSHMPIASSLLSSTLSRLQQSKASYEAAQNKAAISVTLISDEDPEANRPPIGRVEIESAAKGNLGAIRSALSIYYGDREGLYPSDLAQLTAGGKYLARIPSLEVAGHKKSSEVRILTRVRDQKDLEAQLKDTGQWLYVADPDSSLFGTVVIDCRHSDSRGGPWFRY
jgi:hypothetical protein